MNCPFCQANHSGGPGQLTYYWVNMSLMGLPASGYRVCMGCYVIYDVGRAAAPSAAFMVPVAPQEKEREFEIRCPVCWKIHSLTQKEGEKELTKVNPMFVKGCGCKLGQNLIALYHLRVKKEVAK
jgi:hypothetical protein